MLRKLEYTSPLTTRRDAERRRGRALLLLGYLPAVLLFAIMVWIGWSFIASFTFGAWW